MHGNDATLMLRAQQGDRSAFGLLVQRYQDRVYSLALRILHCRQDAEDATQQAFLDAWQQRQAYDPKWPFRPWMYRIATNICIDEYRRQQRCPPITAARLASLVAPNSPARVYEQQERGQALAAALRSVPVEARIVLVLCYLEGLSYAEIAKIRGISVHTVKSQIRRAKALLRQRLNLDEEGTS